MRLRLALFIFAGVLTACSHQPSRSRDLPRETERSPTAEPRSAGVFDSENPGQISQMQKVADFFISAFPDGPIKRGLTRYFEVVGLDAYFNQNPAKGNHGLNRFIARRTLSSPCFGQLADAFNKEQLELDSSLEQKYPTDPKRYMGRRASLADRAGKTYVELEPGWLWNKALRYSKNDPNLAVGLIGVCGHDDTEQGPYKFFDQGIEAKKEIDQMVENLRHEQESLQTEINETRAKGQDTTENGYTVKEAQAQVERIQTDIIQQLQRTGVEREISCPEKQSSVFLPASLGEAWDLPEALKNKIAELQTPVRGRAALPAKYYHVYGSAFATCQMIQEGMPASLAVRIQTEAARFYRGIRLCNLVNGRNKLREDLYSEYQRYTKDEIRKWYHSPKRGIVSAEYLKFDEWIMAKGESIRKDALCRAPVYPNTSFPWPEARDWSEEQRAEFRQKVDESLKEYSVKAQEWHTKHRARCSPFQDAVSNFDLTERPEAESRAMLERLITDINASYLYRDWYIGSQRLFGNQIPCTDVRLFGPKTLMPTAEERQRSWNRCGQEFSNAACEKARLQLAVWESDFEWTKTQHELGARFAAQMCKPVPAGLSPYTMSCQAFERLSTGH